MNTHGWRKDAPFHGISFFCNRATFFATLDRFPTVFQPFFFWHFMSLPSRSLTQFVQMNLLFDCVKRPKMCVDQAAIGVAVFVTAGYSAAQVFHQVPPMVKKSRSVRGRCSLRCIVMQKCSASPLMCSLPMRCNVLSLVLIFCAAAPKSGSQLAKDHLATQLLNHECSMACRIAR